MPFTVPWSAGDLAIDQKRNRAAAKPLDQWSGAEYRVGGMPFPRPQPTPARPRTGAVPVKLVELLASLDLARQLSVKAHLSVSCQRVLLFAHGGPIVGGRARRIANHRTGAPVGNQVWTVPAASSTRAGVRVKEDFVSEGLRYLSRKELMDPRLRAWCVR